MTITMQTHFKKKDKGSSSRQKGTWINSFNFERLAEYLPAFLDKFMLCNVITS